MVGLVKVPQTAGFSVIVTVLKGNRTKNTGLGNGYRTGGELVSFKTFDDKEFIKEKFTSYVRDLLAESVPPLQNDVRFTSLEIYFFRN